MNELLNIADQSLLLHRFPRRKNETLQAWDSADEYLINYFQENNLSQYLNEKDKLYIVNDGFGALSVFFDNLNKTVISDSFLAMQSIKANMQQNHCAMDRIIMQDSLAELTNNVKVVLIKIPKTLSFLEYQLQQLAKVINKDTLVIAAGKVNAIHNSTLALFEKYIGSTKTSLAKKKSRLIFSQADQENVPNNEIACYWPVEKFSWNIHNHANVFSRNHLDIGGRFLMDNLPQGDYIKVADLGCGNGVVGMAAAQTYPDAHITFIDESYMAIDSARINLFNNFEQSRANNSEFVVNNGLVGFNKASFDLILCNPPFHQQHAITDHIAWSMFNDAYHCLANNGHLVIVGNRHLDYQDKLTRIFGSCELVTQNRKFVILKATKQP